MTKEELEKEARKDVASLNGVDLVSSTMIAIDRYGAYKIGRYDGYLAGAETREKRIAELEAQIEKMKNWCNCKNYQECLIELAEQGKGMKPSECCVNCKKWEIKEK